MKWFISIPIGWMKFPPMIYYLLKQVNEYEGEKNISLREYQDG